MRAVGRVALAPARLVRRTWTALRRKMTPGHKLTAKEQTEVKKFTYIGWAGLAPGIIGTAVALGTTAVGLGSLAPILGPAAASIAAAINAPIQGYISAMLTRKLDRGSMGETIDRTQSRQINDLRLQVMTLADRNAKLTERLDELTQHASGPKGRTGGTPKQPSTAKKPGAKATQRRTVAKETGRGSGSGKSTGTRGTQASREAGAGKSGKSSKGSAKGTGAERPTSQTRGKQPRTR